jgi:hypothetical protein
MPVQTRNKPGVTLLELILATAMAGIVILAIGIAFADSFKGWQSMFTSVNDDSVTDGYVARRMFDSFIRKAASDTLELAADGAWLEAQYYNSTASESLDRYGRFYYQDGVLYFEHGTTSPKEALGTQTVSENILSCSFTSAGSSAQMSLAIDAGDETVSVSCSAVMHN